MDPNTRSLLPRWIIAGAVGAITTFGAIAALLRGEYFAPAAMAGVAALIAFQMLLARRKQAGLLLATSPTTAVEYYRKTFSKLPNGEAFVAHVCSLVLTYYGRFDEAREELMTVSWTSLPPMYDGFRTYVLAVIAILKDHDYQKAGLLAEEARDLCVVDRRLPGSTRTRKSLQELVDSCDLLQGRVSQDLISRLHEATRELPRLTAFIPAWTLARYYSESGEIEKSAFYRKRLAEVAPHCTPLVTGQKTLSRG